MENGISSIIKMAYVLAATFFASSSFSQTDPNIVYNFFDDNFRLHDYTYIYPEKKTKIQIDEKIFKNGVASLRFDLAPDTFSGGAICLYSGILDLRPFLKRGAVRFWIKGAQGNEIAWVSLIDDDSDMKKTVVRRMINFYKPIQKEWTCVNIPLKDFKMVQPCYYDSTLRREIDYEFNWERVAEFRIEVGKDENKSFRIWLDDVFIVKKQKSDSDCN
jgi:hypothetical protein